MNLQRREFFAILSACAVNRDELFAQHHHSAEDEVAAYAAYRPRAFTQTEYELLDALAEALLPADETGPGAHDAHVAYYIDVVLYHGNPGAQTSWKNGLAQVEALADKCYKRTFSACSDTQRQELLGMLTKSELDPRTELDRFFVDFKRRVVDGFYASELVQRKHLGYRGNTAIAEFAGCTHPKFEHPAIS